MIVMALDHASAFVAEQHFSEFWGTPLPDYGDGLSLWTRVVSHLCAPGFFLLMGAGMTLFARSRRARGWSEGRISRHFGVRGAVLVGVDLVLVFPAFVLGMLESMLREGSITAPPIPGGGGIPYLSPGVLTALGVCMMVAGLLTRLSTRSTAVLAVSLLLLSQILLPMPDNASELYPSVLRMLLIAGQTGPVMISYPLLPWLAVALLGMVLGAGFAREPGRVMRLALPLGLSILGAFVVLRIAGGFGTHHPIPVPGWMGLFTVTKYPASLVFLMLSLGSNLILLWALESADRRGIRALEWVRVYGRSPLFFYVAHLYVYALMGMIPGHTTLAVMYPFWASGVLILYPACVRYDRFKRAKPEDSIWRLF
jgi:uncharacterized membrane protein